MGASIDVQLDLTRSEHSALLTASRVRSVPLGVLVLDLAVQFAHHNGFHGAAGGVWKKPSPFLGPLGEKSGPLESLRLSVVGEERALLEEAAAYFKVRGPRGFVPIALADFIVHAAMQGLAEGRPAPLPVDRVPPPRPPGAAPEARWVAGVAVGATLLVLIVVLVNRHSAPPLSPPPRVAPHSEPAPQDRATWLPETDADLEAMRKVPAFTPEAAKPSRVDSDNIDQMLDHQYGRPRVPARVAHKAADLPAWLQSAPKAGQYDALNELLEVVPADQVYDVAIAVAVADVAPIHPVPPALVKGIIKRESNFNPRARSKVGAIGLMQLMPYNAERVGLREDDLWVPEKNILGGVRLLAVLLKYYQGDVISALTAYNAKPRKLFAPVPRNGETPDYIAAVLSYYQQYNGAPLKEAHGP